MQSELHGETRAPSYLRGRLLHRSVALTLASLAACLSIETGRCDGKTSTDSAPNIILVFVDDK